VELSLFSQALTQLLYILTKALNLLTTNADDFYFWLDRFLFKEEKQKATLKRIEEAFGYQSNVFIESYRELSIWFQEAKKFGEVQVSFEQWKKFLSIAYGSWSQTQLFKIRCGGGYWQVPSGPAKDTMEGKGSC